MGKELKEIGKIMSKQNENKGIEIILKKKTQKEILGQQSTRPEVKY